ncbi:alpha/beta fold hydrolase [Gryllotalpicola reticulitermitis]|uniref:Alpha/beta fold hydrolase n=1 Tax=Gryllotalpicola reticulitermitis TaxID=1184153 RepID=A0ABV8Q2Z6_9MICO
MTTTPAERPTVLLLHGGAGPATMRPLAAHFADAADVIAPTHPGWNGIPRPDDIDSVRALADHYRRMLADAGTTHTIVIGSSLGGWIGAELALADPELVSALVLIDSAGIEVPGEPVRNLTGLTPAEIAPFSFHDPAKLVVPEPTPENLAIARGNQATLDALAGDPYMHEPTLRGRLGSLTTPTLVLWGGSDRVITPAYGRALADSIPGARFTQIAEAGHLPFLEQPAAVFAALDDFLAAVPAA